MLNMQRKGQCWYLLHQRALERLDVRGALGVGLDLLGELVALVLLAALVSTREKRQNAFEN